MPAGLLKQRNSMLEAISMSILKRCPFYLDAENPTIGKGPGNCDYCNRQAICDSDNQFCDRLDASGKQSLEQRKDEVWENKGEQDAPKKPFRNRILAVHDQEPMIGLALSHFRLRFFFHIATFGKV